MAWTVTINGNTYTDTMFAGFGYVVYFPKLIQDVAAVVGAVQGTVLYIAREPVAADIPSGFTRAVKNTATGRISLYANDGGAIIDLNGISDRS